MKQKSENRRNIANDQTAKNREKAQYSALNSHDFGDFIEEMLSDSKGSDEISTDTPICHVY